MIRRTSSSDSGCGTATTCPGGTCPGGHGSGFRGEGGGEYGAEVGVVHGPAERRCSHPTAQHWPHARH